MKTHLFAFLLLLAWTPDPLSAATDQPIQCANLIYGGTHTSRCFSDEFLSAIQRDSTIKTERRFRTVKLSSDELFQYPFVVMTGEAAFMLTGPERENLKKYLTSGGFLLASAGCSSKEWDRAFRREIRSLFDEKALQKIPIEHPIFRTVHQIESVDLKAKEPNAALEGVEHNGKIVVIYSPHGLNDTANSTGCCCCGGNEIKNSLQLNVNILAYSLLR